MKYREARLAFYILNSDSRRVVIAFINKHFPVLEPRTEPANTQTADTKIRV